MKPIDYRNETWADIQERLTGMLGVVREALIQHGPCTTRQLAYESGIDILAVRPRVCDLCHLGLARLVEDEGVRCQVSGREGVYEAVGISEAVANFEIERRAAIERQMSLRLSA